MPFRLLCAGLRPGETDFPIFLLMPPRVPAAGRQLRAEGDGKPAQRRHAAMRCRASDGIRRSSPQGCARRFGKGRERGQSGICLCQGEFFAAAGKRQSSPCMDGRLRKGKDPEPAAFAPCAPGYAFGLLYGTAPCRTRVIPLERFIVEKGKARGGTAPPGQK